LIRFNALKYFPAAISISIIKEKIRGSEGPHSFSSSPSPPVIEMTPTSLFHQLFLSINIEIITDIIPSVTMHVSTPSLSIWIEREIR